MKSLIRLLLLLLLSNPTLAMAERTLLVIGDSLSSAYNMPLAIGWVALLKTKVASAVRVINDSTSGDTTAQGLTKMPSLLDRYRPEIIIIELGANDGLRGHPPFAIQQNLEAMVRAARARGARVLLLGSDIPPNYGDAYRAAFRRVFTAVAKNTNVTLLPFLLEGIASQPNLMQSDRLHPNAAAQPLILKKVWAALQPLLEEH
jgi:acyl-CoA thioesterase-1